MKHFLFALALVFLSSLLCVGQTVTATTYTDSLTGTIIPPGSSSLSLNADASGALPGSFTISLNLNGTVINDGNWWLVVKNRNADGSVSEIGALSGVVSGGTVSLDSDGRVASLNSVHLAIRSGNGNFVSITDGVGTVQGAFSQQPTQVFNGTLTLSF